MKEIIESLNEFENKKIVINQKGFITISDNNGVNYIKINLNQVFNFEAINNMILFELDNDTIIELH